MIDRMLNVYLPGEYDGEDYTSLVDRLLKEVDPDISEIFEENNGIQGTFLYKWIRILFAREFKMSHVWMLWDVIFTYTPEDFSLYNCISLSLIETKKDEICVVYF